MISNYPDNVLKNTDLKDSIRHKTKIIISKREWKNKKYHNRQVCYCNYINDDNEIIKDNYCSCNINDIQLKKNISPINEKCFDGYKDIHKGKTGILFGTGNTLNLLKTFSDDFINNYVKVGVNKIYLSEDIFQHLDYYFVNPGCYQIDNDYDNSILNMYNKYNDVSLFTALYKNGTKVCIHEKCPKKHEFIEKCKSSTFDMNLSDFETDISKYPVLGHSIVFPALQFMLYTGIKKIYIAGCDISNNYFYQEKTKQNNYYYYFNWWINFKNFVDKNYDDVEIIYINPCGLNGLFKSISTVKI